MHNIMKKMPSIIMLLPVLFLLALLPFQITDKLPFHISMYKYFGNLIFWIMLYIGFIGCYRMARWTKPRKSSWNFKVA